MKKFAILALSALAFTTADAQEITGASSLSLSDVTVGTGQTGIRSVIGTATNRTNGQLHFAVVKINLYDGQGNLLGNTIAQASNVESGAHWRFEAPIMYASTAAYKVVEVDAF